MTNSYSIKINDEFAGLRADVAISRIIPGITRSSVKAHCKSLLINGRKEKFSYICKKNDSIEIEINWEINSEAVPEDIPVDIVYEDENYIVINKPYNMVVHPAKGNYSGTLVNALLGMNKELSQADDRLRFGIVHRLDKETSGLLLVAKNNTSHAYLAEVFKQRKIIKKYHAIVNGDFPPGRHEIITNIGRNPKNRKKMAVLKTSGKKSITVIESVKHINGLSYLDINLLTGRTHQIRVHLLSRGFPILGDLIYSRKNSRYPDVPLCLAAYYIKFFDCFKDRELEFRIDDPLFMNDLLVR